MTIHTVLPGESLWQISRRYNVPYQAIAAANGIDAPYVLAVGQNLYIPRVATTYTVRPGDSLWSISRRFGTTPIAIADVNNIPVGGILQVGQVLTIPSQTKEYGTIEVNAYEEPTGDAAADLRALEEEAAPHLTYLSIFSYRVQENGSLIPPQNEDALLNAARRYGISPLMVVTNFREGTFSTPLAHTILNSQTVQNTLFDNIISTLRAKGYRGVNVDFERVPPDDRDRYTAFLIRLRDRIKPLGYSLSVALAPKISAAQVGAWYEAHDYGAIGSVADFVILMTYEWGWSGGPPMAVAPINQIRRVLDYAVTVIPRNKIMLGMNLYGYDWTLPYMPGGRFARRVSPKEAVQRAIQYGARIQYDRNAESPFYRYYSQGVEHVVWFEDPRSFYAKYTLVRDYRLRGVSYWVLGSSFPANWPMLEELFNIRKY